MPLYNEDDACENFFCNCTCKKITWIVVGLSLAIVTIVLLALSILTVAQDEWALNYGKVTRHVRGDILGPGRYTLQPDSYLITYKNTFRQWDLIFDCWTSDGLDITLDVAIQTRYVEKELYDILFEFGDEDAFSIYVDHVLKKVMRETCSNYTSFDYYNRRGIIQSDMLYKLDNQLPKLGTHITTGGYLQLRNIQLPTIFNQAILDKRSAEQDISVAINQRAQQIIIANTALSQAINQGLVVTNNAKLQADAVLFDAQQQALAITAKYQQRLAVYTIAMNNLKMNATEYVKDILVNKLLDSNQYSSVFI